MRRAHAREGERERERERGQRASERGREGEWEGGREGDGERQRERAKQRDRKGGEIHTAVRLRGMELEQERQEHSHKHVDRNLGTEAKTDRPCSARSKQGLRIKQRREGLREGLSFSASASGCAVPTPASSIAMVPENLIWPCSVSSPVLRDAVVGPRRFMASLVAANSSPSNKAVPKDHQQGMRPQHCKDARVLR